MKFGFTDDLSFFNKLLSKYLISKKRVNFLTSFFKSTKEKMKIGHENKNISISIDSYYIFYFFQEIFL